MKLMTYNIYEGGAGRVDPIAEVIRDAEAEVVVVQEAWDEGLFHVLADRLRMDRFWAGNPRNKEGAVGLLARGGIREAVNWGAMDERVTRGAFHAIVRVEGGVELPVVGLHLHARERMEDERVRLGELPGILEIGALFSGRGHVMAGDFNTSHPLQAVEVEKLRPKARERVRGQGDILPREVIREVLAAGYVDAHGLHHEASEFGTSFTTQYPAMRVDFVFVTPDLAERVQVCEVVKTELAKYASDHFPVLAEMDL